MSIASIGEKAPKMSRKKKTVLIVLIVLAVIGAVCAGILYKLYTDQNPAIIELKDKIKIFICDIRIPRLDDENAGITPGEAVYEDSAKKVIETDKGERLIHYASGYYMDFPEGSEFDLSCSPDYVRVKTEDYSVTISREYSSDRDVAVYAEYYLDRFLLDEGYRQANDIELLSEKVHTGNYDSFSAVLTGYEDGYDGYTYVNVYTGTKIFYRLMFKFNSEEFEDISAQVEEALGSFVFFRPFNKDQDFYTVEFHNLEGHDLSEEAEAVYHDINDTENIYWGLFTQDIYTTGINETIPEYEEELDYTFSIVSAYRHYGGTFPTEFAMQCMEQGKILQLTYQATTTNNEELMGYTPQLDIYRGLCDDEIREFARAAAEFGHPFLFRLGNEMNSDWTSYSGVVNMCDPELYQEVWRRIYNIFQEEGADNAIWIYNPNDRAFPPCEWNNFLAFYPGDEYVHMIGITGYNNGTYYKKAHNEVWREFKEIYDVIWEEYQPFFSEFPWIITEFGSSSIGGDKAQWITDMFEDIYDYPNIKAAIWFDYADFDPAYEGNTVVSRPYWLCENEEITAAVKAGFATQEPGVWHWNKDEPGSSPNEEENGEPADTESEDAGTGQQDESGADAGENLKE